MDDSNNALCPLFLVFFFFQAEDGIRDTSVTGVQTCALPISLAGCTMGPAYRAPAPVSLAQFQAPLPVTEGEAADRKSTRLNSSHRCISYAVFCLKKKTNIREQVINLTTKQLTRVRSSARHTK